MRRQACHAASRAHDPHAHAHTLPIASASLRGTSRPPGASTQASPRPPTCEPAHLPTGRLQTAAATQAHARRPTPAPQGAPTPPHAHLRARRQRWVGVRRARHRRRRHAQQRERQGCGGRRTGAFRAPPTATPAAHLHARRRHDTHDGHRCPVARRGRGGRRACARPAWADGCRCARARAAGAARRRRALCLLGPRHRVRPPPASPTTPNPLNPPHRAPAALARRVPQAGPVRTARPVQSERPPRRCTNSPLRRCAPLRAAPAGRS